MAVFFYIFRGMAWLISRLPIPVLIFMSDLLKILVQHIFRYRKKVIFNNLKNSFPEKSSNEIKKIAGRFYRNLSDIILEVIKLESIKKEKLVDRCRYEGVDVLQRSFDKGRSVIIAIGHCGNWEWAAIAFTPYLPVKGYAIIKPLSNKYFNDYMEMIRNRLYPEVTVPFRKSYRMMAVNRQKMITANLLVSDQTPLQSEITYWTTFLNQDTPFFDGMEKIAKSLDFDVIYMDISRTGRMRYLVTFSLITDDPRHTTQNEITEKYIRFLENSIRENPDNWLWSHRRWKHRRAEPSATVS